MTFRENHYLLANIPKIERERPCWPRVRLTNRRWYPLGRVARMFQRLPGAAIARATEGPTGPEREREPQGQAYGEDKM
jgi:hypothetical protein